MIGKIAALNQKALFITLKASNRAFQNDKFTFGSRIPNYSATNNIIKNV